MAASGRRSRRRTSTAKRRSCCSTRRTSRTRCRFGEAEAAAKDALKLLETRYGPNDRRLVPALTALGGIYFRQARHAEADPYYRRDCD